jgi:3-oxoacid CoA-transferase subunit B
MEHTAKEEPKLLKRCSLPLTGTRVVDLVITDYGVFTIDKYGAAGMTLVELAPDVTVQEIRTKTEASFHVDARLG